MEEREKWPEYDIGNMANGSGQGCECFDLYNQYNDIFSFPVVVFLQPTLQVHLIYVIKLYISSHSFIFELTRSGINIVLD